MREMLNLGSDGVTAVETPGRVREVAAAVAQQHPQPLDTLQGAGEDQSRRAYGGLPRVSEQVGHVVVTEYGIRPDVIRVHDQGDAEVRRACEHVARSVGVQCGALDVRA